MDVGSSRFILADSGGVNHAAGFYFNLLAIVLPSYFMQIADLDRGSFQMLLENW